MRILMLSDVYFPRINGVSTSIQTFAHGPLVGTKDILAPGRGALIAREDPEDFAAKVLQLVHNPGLRKALANDAREYARNWDGPLLAQRMLGLYRSLL